MVFLRVQCEALRIFHLLLDSRSILVEETSKEQIRALLDERAEELVFEDDEASDDEGEHGHDDDAPVEHGGSRAGDVRRGRGGGGGGGKSATARTRRR